jgi:hypothetical protein
MNSVTTLMAARNTEGLSAEAEVPDQQTIAAHCTVSFLSPRPLTTNAWSTATNAQSQFIA